MARVCEVTGKKPLTGHKVSHSNIKSKKRFLLLFKQKNFSLQKKTGGFTLKVSAVLSHNQQKRIA